MDDNPRPNKRPRRNLAGAGIRQEPPRIPIVRPPRPPPEENIRFFYYKRPNGNVPEEPWEAGSWDRGDAFSELLRQWRANIIAIHSFSGEVTEEEKFNNHIEFADESNDETVCLIYRVWKSDSPAPGQPPVKRYVGHVRYRGGVSDGLGSIDFVTRGHTLEFPEKSNDKGEPGRIISDPRLETAILTFMDDGKDQGHIHRVRFLTGHHEWNFKFEAKAETFWARRREVDAEEAEMTATSIRELEEELKGPCSEARSFHDTLLTIGEPPKRGQRGRIYDCYGRHEKTKWAQIKEEEFREWAARDLLLSYNQFRQSDSLDDSDWWWGPMGNIIINERFAGRYYRKGLQLCPWELPAQDPSGPGLKYGYDIQSAADCTLLTADGEAKAIGPIWNKIGDKPGLAALNTLLKSVPPYRDALVTVKYLNTWARSTKTRDALWNLLTSTRGAGGKPIWYVSTSYRGTPDAAEFVKMQEDAGFEVEALPDSYWSLFETSKSVRPPEQEMRRRRAIIDRLQQLQEPAEACIFVSEEETASPAEPAQVQSLSPGDSTRTSQEQTPVETSTIPSTASSDDRVSDTLLSKEQPLDASKKHRGSRFLGESAPPKESPLRESVPASDEPSTELLSHVMTGPDNALMQRIRQLETELQAERTEAQAQKARLTALQLEASDRSTATLSSDGDRMDIGDEGPANAFRGETVAQEVVPGVTPGAPVLDHSAEERVFPVPSGYFPSEVMRLVQFCLRLCPQPLDTYTCLPIEGGTGIVVAGFCRFDHDQRSLKIHRDWLSFDRMKQEFGGPEDTMQAELLCFTVLTLWEELFKSEAPRCLDEQGGSTAWARCRHEIRRSLLDYRQVCRQITVPEVLLKRGEITVASKTLVSSGWANANDTIHIALHYKDCPWARQATRVADPHDRHFTEITSANNVNEDGQFINKATCDPGRFCHGVSNKGMATVPFFLVKFPDLDIRKKYFVVAKNISQPSSLVVILDGHHSPLANPGNPSAPFATEWTADLEQNLSEYVARSYMLEPIFRVPRRPDGQLAALQGNSPPSRQPVPSATAEPPESQLSFGTLEALLQRIVEEQEKLHKLSAEHSPDPAAVEVSKSVIAMLQKRANQERRDKQMLSRLSDLRPPPLPNAPTPPRLPPSGGPPTRPPSGFRHPLEEYAFSRPAVVEEAVFGGPSASADAIEPQPASDFSPTQQNTSERSRPLVAPGAPGSPPMPPVPTTTRPAPSLSSPRHGLQPARLSDAPTGSPAPVQASAIHARLPPPQLPGVTQPASSRTPVSVLPKYQGIGPPPAIRPVSNSLAPLPAAHQTLYPRVAQQGSGQSPRFQLSPLRRSVEAQIYESVESETDHPGPASPRLMEPLPRPDRDQSSSSVESLRGWNDKADNEAIAKLAGYRASDDFPKDAAQLSKGFFYMPGDEDLRPQVVNARIKVCRQWRLTSEQLLSLFPGMETSRSFLVNLSKIAMSMGPLESLRLLQKMSRERRHPHRDVREFAGVAILAPWAVSDSVRALFEAGLSRATTRVTPDLEIVEMGFLPPHDALSNIRNCIRSYTPYQFRDPPVPFPSNPASIASSLLSLLSYKPSASPFHPFSSTSRKSPFKIFYIRLLHLSLFRIYHTHLIAAPELVHPSSQPRKAAKRGDMKPFVISILGLRVDDIPRVKVWAAKGKKFARLLAGRHGQGYGWDRRWLLACLPDDLGVKKIFDAMDVPLDGIDGRVLPGDIWERWSEEEGRRIEGLARGFVDAVELGVMYSPTHAALPAGQPAS